MQMKIQICPEFTWIQEKYHCFFQRFQLRPIWHKEIRGLRHQVHKELAGKVSGGFIQRLDILWSYEALLLYRSCGKLETKVFLWPKQATYPPLSAFIIVCTKTPWVQRAPPGSPRWTEGEKQLEEWVPEKGWGAEQLCVPHSQPAQKSTYVRTGEKTDHQMFY